MRKPPLYIRKANIDDATIRYPWDDWNVEGLIGPPSQTLLEDISRLSLRAGFAFLTASAEWVVYRFANLTDISIPLDATNSAWAQDIHRLYCTPRSPFRTENWSGPVRGPIRTALGLLRDYADLLGQKAEMAQGCGEVFALLEHIISRREALYRWRDHTITRFKKHFGRNLDDPLGDPVPREALDPEFNFEPGSTELLLNQYLGGLEPGKSLFLMLPDTMLDSGFMNTPYCFQLEADRAYRQIKRPEE
ncbi:protein of unknown function [Nitrospira defluvii]|uniref:Uncharacterized protein n=1 Tax=Nitrospira defluvii TaxID=330214 RepID=D8PEQ8_9BACT|nr:protein of unknown function [Nitrospira defluvii]